MFFWKKTEKFSYTQEQFKCVGTWIEYIIGEPLEDINNLHKSLKTGTVLCKLITVLAGIKLPNFHKDTEGLPFKEMENIAFFMQNYQKLGIKCGWTVKALHRGLDMNAVVHSIIVLSDKIKESSSNPASGIAFKGPFLDLNKPLPPFDIEKCKKIKEEYENKSTSVSTEQKISTSPSTTNSSLSDQNRKSMGTAKKMPIVKRMNSDLSNLSSINQVTPRSPVSNLSVSDSPLEKRTVSFSDQNTINLEAIKEAENQIINNANSSASGDNTNEMIVPGKPPKRGRGTIATLNRPNKVLDESILTKDEINAISSPDTLDERSVIYHVINLKATIENPLTEYLQYLSTFIQQQNKEWVEDFVRNGAVRLLGDIIMKNEVKFKTLKQSAIQEYCVGCLKSIADNEVFHGFFANKSTINSIALLLDMKMRSASNYLLKSKILELLAVLCNHSEDGFWCVLDAMSTYKTVKNEAARFSDLINSLSAKYRSDTKLGSFSTLSKVTPVPKLLKQDTQAFVLLLINALINCPQEQATRAFIREEITKLNAVKFVEEMKEEIANNEITSQLLISQVKVFEEEMMSALIEEDMEPENPEVSLSDSDEEGDGNNGPRVRTDVDDNIRSLKLKLGTTAGGIVALSNILRSLVKLAQNSKNESILSSSLESISNLMKYLVDKALNKSEKGHVEDILGEIDLLNKRIKQMENEKELLATSDKMLEKFATEKNALEQEVAQLKNELKILQDRFQKLYEEKEELVAALETRKADLEISKSGDSEQLSELKQQIETLRKEYYDKEKLALQKLEMDIIDKIEEQLSMIEKHTGDIPVAVLDTTGRSALGNKIDSISRRHFIVLDRRLQEMKDSISNESVSTDSNDVITNMRLEIRMLKQQRNTLLSKFEESNMVSNTSHLEVNQLKNEIEDLRKQLQVAKTQLAISNSAAPRSDNLGTKDISDTPSLLGDVKSTPSPVSASSLLPSPPSMEIPLPPPPPPIMESPPPPPPAMDTSSPPSPPPPIMGSPPPPPPPPIMGSPPPPAPSTGGPPLPPAMGIPMKADVALPKLPSIGTSSKSMKNFYCDSIAKNKVSDTIWVKGGIIDEIASIKIDTSELEDLFSNETSNTQTPSEDVSKKKKKEVVTLVEPQKSNNVALLLGYMRMEPEQIKEAILNMDEEKLSQSNIEALKDKTPSPDEIEALNSYNGDVELLSKADKFFLQIKDIPRLSNRLNCWAFKYKFANDIAQILPDIQSLTLAICEVTESTKFKKFLAIVLALTNFLNSRSKKETYGFKLKSLLKLSETKSSKNNMSLLQYIAVYCEKTNPELLDIAQDMPHLDAAIRISLPDLKNEVKKLNAGVKLIEKELSDEYDRPNNDKFEEVMRKFLTDAQEKLKDITAALINLDNLLTNLVRDYAEDKEVTKNPGEFLQQIKKFLDAYVEGFKAYQRKTEAEKKRKSAAENKPVSSKIAVPMMPNPQTLQLQIGMEALQKSADKRLNMMDGSAFRVRRYSRMEQRQPTFQPPALKKTGVNLK